MFVFFFFFCLSALLVPLPAQANSSGAPYENCLRKAERHAANLLNLRGLHHVTAFCLRQARNNAQTLRKQYHSRIKPDVESHMKEVKACKADAACSGVEKKKLTYQTAFQPNCNRPKVSYAYNCDMNMDLKGVKRR